jgi:hypothetical protein
MSRPKATRREPFFAPPPPRFSSAPPRAAGGEQIRRQDVDEAALQEAAADVRAKWQREQAAAHDVPDCASAEAARPEGAPQPVA